MRLLPVPAPRALAALLAVAVSAPAFAQINARAGAVAQRYTELCANCHGKAMEGGQAPSMLDDVWAHGGDDESLFRSIKNGFPDKGMPPWGAAIPEKDIRAMVIYIREVRALAEREKLTLTKPADSVTAQSQLHNFQVNTWVGNLSEPYGLAFLPNNQAVVTEKRGKVWLIDNGKKVEAEITGFPAVDTQQQAGLYDVVAHPNYAQNGWIYFAFADLQGNRSLTRVIRGKLKDGALVEQQDVFKAPLEIYPPRGRVHFGGRIVFDKAGYLFFTIGERGEGMNSQNLAVPMGKVHRVHDDGRIPQDNPFVGRPDALGTIWSYGHRNPQGLAMNAAGELYDVEHGPRGGDELNLVRKSLNFGWPIITYGMNYNGQPMPTSEGTAKPGMEQPAKYWLPSIAPCGANFYNGNLFPKWKDSLFVASLAAQELHRVEVKNGKVTADETLFQGLGRARHVIGGPDGALYVLLPDRIARVTPAN